MKRLLKTGMLVLTAAMLLTGCSGQGGKKETEETKPSQTLYPVSIDGKEILMGETKMQTLLDNGLRITVSEKTEDNQINQVEIDSEMELESNSYYSGGTIWITDSIFANISLVTDEEVVKMGDAVIGQLEFYLSSEKGSEMERIAFNGVPVSEISREKAGEMFPDFTGDDNMLLQYGTDYEYFMSFNQEDSMLNRFSITKEYDVDWTSSN